jgi:hypothetical protein
MSLHVLKLSQNESQKEVTFKFAALKLDVLNTEFTETFMVGSACKLNSHMGTVGTQAAYKVTTVVDFWTHPSTWCFI